MRQAFSQWDRLGLNLAVIGEAFRGMNGADAAGDAARLRLCKQMVDRARQGSGISYVNALLAVRSVLEDLAAAQRDGLQFSFKSLLTTLPRVENVEPDECHHTVDGRRLLELFAEVTTISQDCSQMGWMSAGRTAILRTVAEALVILTDGHPGIVRQSLAADRLHFVHSLIAVYQLETSTGNELRSSILSVLTRICELSADGQQHILDSVLPVHLASEVTQVSTALTGALAQAADNPGVCPPEVGRLTQLLRLLTFVFAAGEPACVSTFEVLDERFLGAVMRLLLSLHLAALRLVDVAWLPLVDDLLHLCFLFLCAFNLQMIDCSEGDVTHFNYVVRAVYEVRQQTEYVKEQLLTIANRATDPLADFHCRPAAVARNGALKLLLDCLCFENAMDFFYASDVCLLLDMCYSQLTNHLQPGDQIRAVYLRVLLYALVNLKSADQRSLEYDFDQLEKGLISVCRDSDDSELEILADISTALTDVRQSVQR